MPCHPRTRPWIPRSCGSNVDWVIPQLIAARLGKYAINATSQLVLQKTCRYWASDWATDHSYWTNIGKDDMRLADVREMFARDQVCLRSVRGMAGAGGGSAAKMADGVLAASSPFLEPRLHT